jgi:hypothetical protein
MRVGFVTQLLWSRYGEFGPSSSRELARACLRPHDGVRRALGDPRLDSIPVRRFAWRRRSTCARGRRHLCARPQPRRERHARRGPGRLYRQLSGALATTLVGLPPIIGIPASLSEAGLEGLVVSTLLNLTHDPGWCGASGSGSAAWRERPASPNPSGASPVRRRYGRRGRSAVAAQRRAGAARGRGSATPCRSTR